MTELSFPFTDLGGGDDGPYSASFFAQIFEEIFSQTTLIEGSVLPDSGQGGDLPLDVVEESPAAASVEMKRGSAFIQGFYYNNDSNKSHTIGANTDGSGDDRIDSIILEVDFINQVVRSKVLVGTVAPSPVAPTLTKNSSIYQVTIADITVQNLFTTILTADIDTTVKTFSYKMNLKSGGTGRQTYTDGDMLWFDVAATDLFSIVNIQNRGHVAAGVGSAIESLDLHPITVEYQEANGVNAEGYTVGVWNTITQNVIDDPTTYATLAANQIELVAGRFRVDSINLGISNQSGNSFRARIRLYNVTQAAVIAFGKSVEGTGGGGGDVTMNGARFTTVTNDKIELQIWPTTDPAGVESLGRTVNTGATSTETTLAEVYSSMTFTRVG